MTGQEMFESSLQDVADHFDITKDDFQSAMQDWPLEEVGNILSDNPNNTADAEKILGSWVEENIMPLVEKGLHDSQIQAVDTILGWHKSMGAPNG